MKSRFLVLVEFFAQGLFLNFNFAYVVREDGICSVLRVKRDFPCCDTTFNLAMPQKPGCFKFRR